MKPRIVLGVFGLFLILTMFFQTVYAQDIVTNRTGTIELDKLDGTGKSGITIDTSKILKGGK